MKKIAVFAVTMLFLSTLTTIMPAGADSGDKKILEIIESVDENTLYYYDKTIQDMGPHPTGSEECNRVADFIYNELKSYGLDVQYFPWEKKGLSGKNIVATLPGEDNLTVIISAHYDSVKVSPGADDDGSGVSCILMAAKILRNYSFKHTIKFVLFSGEEQGLYGSERFVREMYEKNEMIIADLQLDGVGHAVSNEGGSKIRISSNGASSLIANEVERMAEEYNNIGLQVIRFRDFPGSDHQSFINYGYKGVFFLEYEFNPYYHSSGDSIEHVNFTYMAKVCKLASATLASIADEHISLIAKIVEPERGGIYFGERKIFSLNDYKIIVIGRITVGVEIYSSENVSRVEFYMDGELRGVDEEIPYEYQYGKILFFKHHISIVAYGEKDWDMGEMDAYVFNPIPKYWLK